MIIRMIKISSLQQRYNTRLVLTFSDWAINQGEHWLMLGESGSGKTTLLHLLTGLLKPTGGEVLINNTSIYKLNDTQLDRFRGKHIGLIFQRPHLIKSLNVAENLMLAQSLAGLPANRQRIDEVLESLNIADKKRNYPSELSQGQLQRVSIGIEGAGKKVLVVVEEAAIAERGRGL